MSSPVLKTQPALVQAWLKGGQAHPGFVVSQVRFCAELVRRLPRHAAARGLAELRAADLYLALGCLSREQAALSTFERSILLPLQRDVTRRHGDLDAAEVVQQLRTRLLLEGRLADYSGRGSLRGYVRMAAERLALDLRRARRAGGAVPEADAPPAERLAPSREGPERRLVAFDAAHRVQRALSAAARELTPKERQLLRMHHEQGLTVEKIARELGAPRSTVGLWLVQLRSRLLERIRERLGGEQGVPGAEIDSLIASAQPHLHVSLSKL